MRTLIALALLLALGMSGGGCLIAHKDGHGHLTGLEIILPRGHVCSNHCGHYQRHGRWFHNHGHVHGPGCGHHFHGGFWIHKD